MNMNMDMNMDMNKSVVKTYEEDDDKIEELYKDYNNIINTIDVKNISSKNIIYNNLLTDTYSKLEDKINNVVISETYDIIHKSNHLHNVEYEIQNHIENILLYHYNIEKDIQLTNDLIRNKPDLIIHEIENIYKLNNIEIDKVNKPVFKNVDNTDIFKKKWSWKNNKYVIDK